MRRLSVVALVVLILGCQQSPPQSPASAPPKSPAAQLGEEGDALAARGDYEAAAAKYRAAVAREPDDVPLRFALGVALSHLGRRQETIEQFRFVVARGNPNSQEFQAAQHWLINAGELAQTAAVEPSADAEPEAGAAASPPAASAPTSPASPQGAKVRVRTEPRPGIREVNIVLLAEERGELAYTKTVKPGEAFEFTGVLPGNYRLMARDAETDSELWNMQVTVARGQDLVLDLK